jgi:uroporphyrinogen decarboxylase
MFPPPHNRQTMTKASAKVQRARKLIISALEGEVTARAPFWLMRQAGRHLPEYRKLRLRAGSFLDLCFSPAMAAEATLQPVRRYDTDAAILFSDILVVPYALGQKLTFEEGEGPRLSSLKQHLGEKKEVLDSAYFDDKLAPVYETLRRVKSDLPGGKALIGFAGAPWTLACYMLQGSGDGEFADAREFAYARPELFGGLIERLVEATSRYLIHQIKNGADAVQIFDSWAGLLPEPFFNAWVVEPTRDIVHNVRRAYPGFPVIGFPRGAGAFLKTYAARTGVSGLGLDTAAPLQEAVKISGGKLCLQGNLDPAVLLAGGKVLKQEALRLLEATRKTPFIFNLGHGVMKQTPTTHVAELAAIIGDFRR